MPPIFTTALSTAAVAWLALISPTTWALVEAVTEPNGAYSNTATQPQQNDGLPEGVKAPPADWNPFPYGVPVGNADAPFMITVEPLPYAYSELEPVIDAETMRIHYEKHHKGYAVKYNALIRDFMPHPSFADIASLGFTGQLRHLNRIPEQFRNGIRNNLGGVLNHGMFWPSLRSPVEDNIPGPDNLLGQALIASFGSFERFKLEFSGRAMDLFGSGWTWMVVDCETMVPGTSHFKLTILNLPNQDYPQSGTPLMNLDLFEHAYYLKYRNDRASYVKGVWDLWNWVHLEEKYAFACPKDNNIKTSFVSRDNKVHNDYWQAKLDAVRAEQEKKKAAEAAGIEYVPSPPVERKKVLSIDEQIDPNLTNPPDDRVPYMNQYLKKTKAPIEYAAESAILRAHWEQMKAQLRADPYNPDLQKRTKEAELVAQAALGYAELARNNHAEAARISQKAQEVIDNILV